MNNTLCFKCACGDNEECGYYEAYNKIYGEVVFGLGTDDKIGAQLYKVLEDNPITECEYFMEKS